LRNPTGERRRGPHSKKVCRTTTIDTGETGIRGPAEETQEGTFKGKNKGRPVVYIVSQNDEISLVGTSKRKKNMVRLK